MDKSYDVIENYLSMLGGEDNIIYYHATVDSVTEVIKVATVTNVGKKYHLLYTIGTDVVIAKTYPSLNTISRILKEIQPN